eukprot:COSAG06_NODE_2501_length_6754_cov_6.727122_2_plen_129_part_00
MQSVNIIYHFRTHSIHCPGSAAPTVISIADAKDRMVTVNGALPTRSDKKSVVYPDGYIPGVREQDRSKATPEMRERMSGGRHGKGDGGSRHAKANAARRSRFRFGGAIRAQPCRTSRAGGGEVGRTKA